MIPTKALLLAFPLAAGGGWLVHSSSGRIGDLRAELLRLDGEVRDEGASYLRTLQGSHAQRQLDALSRRRAAALDLAAARRDRLLGGLLLGFAAVVFFSVRAAGRIARDLEEDRRLLQGSAPRPPGAPRGPDDAQDKPGPSP